MIRTARLLVVAAATSAIALLASTTANAATFTVTTTADSNDGACTPSLCSLRDAIIAADGAGGASTITLPAGTFKLTIAAQGGDPAINPAKGDLDVEAGATVTIAGAGSGSTIVDAAGLDRAFAVQPGASLALSGMTVENGAPSAFSTDPGQGGAILDLGALNLSGDVAVRTSLAQSVGGGVFVGPTSTGLTVSGSQFTGNNGSGGGGGIFIDASASVPIAIAGTTFAGNTTTGGVGGAIYDALSAGLSISGSSFNANVASANGGALMFIPAQTLSITGSSFSGNTAGSGAGGAIYAPDVLAGTFTGDAFSGNVAGTGGAILVGGSVPSAPIRFNGDEIDGNTGASAGGGIYWASGTLTIAGTSLVGNHTGGPGGALLLSTTTAATITNTTISGNTALEGGGIFFGSAPQIGLVNDTIAFNSALATNGGGIFHPSLTAPGGIGVVNTIVAENSGGDCGQAGANSKFNASDDVGHNLDSDSTCFGGLGAPGDLVGVNPVLGSAAGNGGGILTDALLGGSPAIDAGTATGCPAADERGVARPQGAACDIGAFEVAGADLALSGSAPATASLGGGVVYALTVTDNGPGPSSGAVLADTLPSGMTLVAAIPSQGSCSGTTAIKCVLGTIASGATATVTIVANAAAQGVQSDSAVVGGAQADPNSANNSATFSTAVGLAPVVATAPVVVTGAAKKVTKAAAQLTGTVTPQGLVTTYVFKWGTTASFGHTTKPVSLTNGTLATAVSVSLGHLARGTKYHYELVATNADGTTTGLPRTFTTQGHRKTKKHKHH